MKNADSKIITPLRRLLMAVPLDNLFAFIDQLHLQYSFVCERGAEVKRMKLFQNGTLIYEAGGKSTSHAVVADCLAKFLVGERKDFHDYVNKNLAECPTFKG